MHKHFWVRVAGLCLCPIWALAQSPDVAHNLEACKAGLVICDRSRLSQSESEDIALAVHARNTANCRNGYDSCDHSQLTEPEATALAVAEHRRNVSACDDGMQSCDRAKL